MTAALRAEPKAISTWYVDPGADDVMADRHAPIWRHFVDLVPEQDLRGKAVLDFGCNQGGFLRLLHRLRPFRTALGVDIAAQSVAKAEELRGDRPIRYAVGGTVDADAAFDIAFSHEVIYLVEDLAGHAADIHRALKPGGVYYAVTGCHTGNPMWPSWRDLVAQKTNTVVQDRSVTDYATVFATAGFTVSARPFAFADFVPYEPSGWMPDFAAALDYYTRVKTLFRLVKP